MSTSADHPNAVRVRDAYTRWFAGITSPLMQLLSDEMVYHLPGRHLGGGDLYGREAILTRGREYVTLFDEPARSDVYDVVANDDFAVSFERFQAKRRDRILDQVICGIWRLRDGRAVEIWAHFEDQDACDAFWE